MGEVDGDVPFEEEGGFLAVGREGFLQPVDVPVYE